VQDFHHGLVAAGSTYYHLRPDNGTLFWDRLPMTVVFVSLLADAGLLLLLPLVALSVASVLYWRFANNLRLYGLVQYYPMAALPLVVVLFPPRYSGAAAQFDCDISQTGGWV
jgi:hypothetical protein